MSLIANFPPALLTEHANWHMAHMNEKKKGEGIAFLDFHRHFIQEFHAWYEQQAGADQSLVAPWTTLPDNVLANLPKPVARKWLKIAANPAVYKTEDELGIAIHPLHDDVHGAIAAAFGESGMNSPDTAPKYTEFWRLHGLINAWLGEWQQSHGA